MTLITYDADRLDEAALRTLDVAAILRGMAQRCRDEEIAEFPLHDKKAMEWLAKLEVWAHEARTRLDLVVMQHRGAKRAAEFLERQSKETTN